MCFGGHTCVLLQRMKSFVVFGDCLVSEWSCGEDATPSTTTTHCSWDQDNGFDTGVKSLQTLGTLCSNTRVQLTKKVQKQKFQSCMALSLFQVQISLNTC